MQAAALPPAQIFDRGAELRAHEAHPLQELAGGELLAARHIRAFLSCDHIHHAGVEDVGELVELLTENRHSHGLTSLDAAGSRLQGSRDEAQQGALARPVDAQDARAFTGRDQPIDVRQHLPLNAGGWGGIYPIGSGAPRRACPVGL